ncbi:hypothetical protein HC928_18570 [bacterium]|nr:hypothetical protein [bacterium]
MFISVDSVRDTPEAVRRYLDNFDPAFVGFSPDDTTLSRIQPDYDFTMNVDWMKVPKRFIPLTILPARIC